MRDRKVLEGKLKHSALVFTECYTGSCGSEAKHVHLLYAGSDVDQHANELALENAEMYGIYPGEPEDEDDEAEYSEGIEGAPYLFHPDDLGHTHTTAHEVLGWLREIGAITWLEGFSNIITIHREIIPLAMDYDFESFCELVEDNISGEFHIAEDGISGKFYNINYAEKNERTSVINKDRLFGKFASNEGWTIKELLEACEGSQTAETSLDDMLGGDLAASEHVVRDLIAYIQELERK